MADNVCFPSLHLVFTGSSFRLEALYPCGVLSTELLTRPTRIVLAFCRFERFPRQRNLINSGWRRWRTRKSPETLCSPSALFTGKACGSIKKRRPIIDQPKNASKVDENLIVRGFSFFNSKK